MSKQWWKWLALAALSGAAVLTINFAMRSGKPQRTVKVGLTRLAPFEPARINGIASGFLVDLLEGAARRKGIRLVWTDAPEGGERSLEKRLVDIWPQMEQTASRQKLFHITRPFLRKDFCLVSPQANPVRTPRETEGRKVSLVDGPLTRALAESSLPRADRRIVNSRTEAITSLCRGEADAAFSETSYFQLLMLNRPEDCASFRFAVSPVPGQAIRMGVAALPHNARLAETLRDGIEELRADGEFSRLLARWMPMALSENESLFQEHQERTRSFRIASGLSAAAVLMLLLLWHNRRVSRAKRLTEQANAALQASLAQLRDAHQRLRFQVDRMPLACIVWDTSLRIREWNPAAEKIFGWTAAEAKGKSISELLPRAAAEADGGEIWRGIAAGEESGRHEQENVARDGRQLVCEWVSAPLRDEGGKVTDLLSLAHDVTERKRLEEDLRQAQKLESIGRLAGGVAHDFNNLLTVINGNCDLLLGETDIQEPLREALLEIRKAGERAANLTHQLLAFSRKQLLRPGPLDLNAVLREHHGMFRRLLGEDILLQVRPAAALGLVMADAGQIHQVLLNLLANARDAMPDGGTVTVVTANVELSAADCAGRAEVVPGPFVELSVTDTGTGMDRETGQRIFEPFFTTKGRATATGLGLPMVHGVVRQSGGWIEVSSELGKGTTFLIRLPRAAVASPVTREGGEQDTGAIPTGAGTVLLVEDQTSVRRLAARVLIKAGFSVLDVGSGAEAVALAENHPEPIDVLLTDLVMPGMKGPEVAAAVRRIRPEAAVLYMSGYGADLAAPTGAGATKTAVLSKPFTPAALVAGVRAALERNRRA